MINNVATNPHSRQCADVASRFADLIFPYLRRNKVERLIVMPKRIF